MGDDRESRISLPVLNGVSRRTVLKGVGAALGIAAFGGAMAPLTRVVGDLTLGAEGRIDGNALDRDARGGLFLRYAWSGGEVSLAGGVSGRVFEDARDMTIPYATLNWLTQY